MLPVGLALLAHDIPMIRRPMARLLHFTNRKIEERKSENTPKADVRHSLTKNPKFIDHAAGDGRTNERTKEHADPSASNYIASNRAANRTNEPTDKFGDPSESNHVATNDAEYSTDYSRDL
jgi:hypothetical protein